MAGKKDHRNRVHVVALAALLVFQSLGWFGVWSALHFGARIQAHRAMQAGPAAGDLKITLPADSLRKLKIGPHEIRFSGRLYDIRFSRQSGDSVVLHLYHDHSEEHLYRLLGKLLCPGDAVPAFAGQWLAQWVSAMYLVPALPDWQILMPEFLSIAIFEYAEPAGITDPDPPARPPAC